MGRAYEVRKASMAKTASAKTKVYSRFGKEIFIAAKTNPNIDSNSVLKNLVARAKKQQVPGHVIDKAIQKAKGGDGEDYVPYRYEGYGPGGSMVIIDCLSDNVNRTVSEVRNCFTKCDCKMGVSGAVTHMYSNLAIISMNVVDEDELLECLLEGDVEVEDVESEDTQTILYTNPKDLYKAQDLIKEKFTDIEIDMAESSMIPMTYTSIEDAEISKTFQKFLNMLEECEDVQNVYHNVEKW